MEIINNSAQTEQVGDNWWICGPICAGSCFIAPVYTAMGLAAVILF